MTVTSIDRWLRRFAYCVGSAADVDAEAALLGALTEYGQSERNLRLAVAAPDWRFARALRWTFDVRRTRTRASSMHFSRSCLTTVMCATSGR